MSIHMIIMTTVQLSVSCQRTNKWTNSQTAPWVKKNQDTKLWTSPSINRFLFFFAGRLSGKCATNSCLNIPPDLYISLHYLVKYECQKTGGNLKYVWWLKIKSHGSIAEHLSCDGLRTYIHPFNGPFSGSIQVRRYQKDKTNLDFTEATDS